MTPLNGIKVLELARVLAGPWAGQTLADLGATVIKVESPMGDETRTWGKPVDEDGTAAYFHSCNNGKRSIALDFRNTEDLAIVKELASDADVIIENFKVGGLKKYGLDYDSLAPVNSGLVYCSITGFGQDGPYAHRPGYDFVIQAMSGIMDLTGAPDAEPQKMGVAFSDIFTGLYATIAIQAALAARANTGVGDYIDMALLDSQIGVLANQASGLLKSGAAPTRLGNTHPSIVPYQVFETADAPLVIACGNDGQFKAMSEALSLELHLDPRFETNPERLRHRDILTELLNEALRQTRRDDLLQTLEKAGVPAGPINSVKEAFTDPQVMYRGLTINQRIRNPIRFANNSLNDDRGSPRLNEHNKEIRDRLWNIDNLDEQMSK